MNPPLLLNYHDACVYKSDLRLVESPKEWLNDACINFQMTRLQQRHNANANSSPSLLFLDPAVVSYMMHQCDEEDLADLGQSWCADLKRTCGDADGNDRPCGLLVPINDHNAASSAAFQSVGGGNHWSMLLVVLACIKSQGEEKFAVKQMLHFDSHGRCNSTAAVAVGSKICHAFGSPNNSKIKLTHCSTPQQNNGHDCGIFALGAAEALSEPSLWAKEKIVAQDMEEALMKFVKATGGAEFAKNMRQRIGQDIRELASAQ